VKQGLLFVHALSSLHAGTGSALDVIDLPIARERATALPYVPGSSIKGVLRETCEDRERLADLDKAVKGDKESPEYKAAESAYKTKRAPIWAAFGPDTANASEHAGALLVGDANLLLFPVRSLTGLFLWVTSPYLLRRFLRDREEAGRESLDGSEGLTTWAGVKDGEAYTSFEPGPGGKVLLEDGDAAAALEPALQRFARALAPKVLGADWTDFLSARLVVVPDTLLGAFTRMSTEVVARVKIDQSKGTVQKGGLWYEEALPAESILYARLLSGKSRAKNDRGKDQRDGAEHLELVSEVSSVQLGGKASVGRGLCRLQWEVK
jgi:CRISPR-associated protein Cmr4